MAILLTANLKVHTEIERFDAWRVSASAAAPSHHPGRHAREANRPGHTFSSPKRQDRKSPFNLCAKLSINFKLKSKIEVYLGSRRLAMGRRGGARRAGARRDAEGQGACPRIQARVATTFEMYCKLNIGFKLNLDPF